MVKYGRREGRKGMEGERKEGRKREREGRDERRERWREEGTRIGRGGGARGRDQGQGGSHSLSSAALGGGLVPRRCACACVCAWPPVPVRRAMYVFRDMCASPSREGATVTPKSLL